MKHASALKALCLSLTWSLGTAAAVGRAHDVAARDADLSLGISQWAANNYNMVPGDIPPSPPNTIQWSFIVANPLARQQACSATLTWSESGHRVDQEGHVWYKCGTDSTPDPTCTDCTHFQLRWGFLDANEPKNWRMAVNQTWTSDS
ncbi:hypothetical protein GGR52DRAFT_574170 [Hypoxylon sp. FL1284]|nr:hypothetical protein GGR52DRAFT_574170 [Hypoxylon sp. FL1284]